ncbi:serine/threonine-protein kinase [Actinomadura bangladeshensis]|uniref:non-specific serine/threonine protein kinase n=1 Tax=Actinomadura bangladeshensis TaxID=453573 RepID=A0A4R4NMN7_9ACTN|nr:serine/threonine-protein kinase [Actinomadura bangladeshensis]TDC09103.1 serine/threonine protein kinase [Actinomadura bangladeshensis]
MAEWRVSEFDEVRELGRGAQGRVALARHGTSGTPVAIKYLPAGAGPEAKDAFRNEARMLGRVDDPHVARLYRLVEHEDGAALIMEAVEGVPLKRVLAEHGALGPEAALLVLKGSLRGLAAAHAAGVVHRDYKPANVVVRADGLSKLIDFGIAVWTGEGDRSGTPVYMAPEQWRGEPATPATDVYAATCVFYECVTGERPYRADDRLALMGLHATAPIPVENVPEPLRTLVLQGMSKEPAYRPPSAAHFVGELDRIAVQAYGPDWERRGVRALALAAAALAALFPLAAAGLVPAGAGAGAAAAGAGAAAGTSGAAASGTAAGSGGVLSAVGGKAGVAIAGAAIAGTAAAGVGVYAATRPARDHVTVAATPTPSGKRMSFGAFSITVPESWRLTRLTDLPGNPEGNYWVSTPGRCSPSTLLPEEQRDENRKAYDNNCPGFTVIGEPWVNDGSTGWRSFRVNGPWGPETEAFRTCPHRGDLNGIGTPEDREKPARTGTGPVGTRSAQYREWRLNCVFLNGANQFRPAGAAYVQRYWYLADPRLLIVDEWDTPGLREILAKATWA